jgi:membrane protein
MKLRLFLSSQGRIAAPNMINWVHFRQQGIQLSHRLDMRTHGWLGLLTGAARQALKPASVVTAAAIAYFFIFSLFPLALLSIAIASFSLGPLVDPHLILQKLEFIAPSLVLLLGKNIEAIVKARGPVTVAALISLVWSASTIFYMLTGALNDIWETKHNRPLWKRRGLAILLVLAIIGPALFLASFASSLTANLLTRLPEQIMPVVNGASWLLAILLDAALFFLLYLLLPHAGAGWRELIPGALGAGLFWELAKKIFLYFVTSYISVSNMVYGSVAGIIALLTWAYLSGLIFLFGAYFSMAYHQHNQHQKEMQADIKANG